MKIAIPQLHFSKIMRAVTEFNLIEDGDKILIGLSGGKDSLFLTYALAFLKERLKKNFSLRAVTINPLFDNEFDIKRLENFCATLEIPFDCIEVDIAGTIKSSPNKNPCYTCAFFRRGAVNSHAVETGCNKVAYAHHHDDAVETFLMSLFYSGQLQTFTPLTYHDRTNITVIRPLVYLREQEIIAAQSVINCEVVPSPCPYNGKTIRQTVKELIASLSNDNPLLYEHLSSAMRESALKTLWPPAKTRAEMREIYFSYMRP